MNTQTKQRLVGVIILTVFFLIAIPFLMSGSKKPQHHTQNIIQQNKSSSPKQNYQTTIQFDTPSGSTIVNQTTPTTNKLNSDSSINDTDTSLDQPPVFQHQDQKTPLPENSISAATSIQPHQPILQQPTNDLKKEKLSPKNDVAFASTPVKNPSNNHKELQQAIIQKETAIITNNKSPNKSKNSSPKSSGIKHPTQNHIKKKNNLEKKSKLPILQIKADDDLQRLINEEKNGANRK